MPKLGNTLPSVAPQVANYDGWVVVDRTADEDPGATATVVEIARIWRDMPKVVYSRTLERAEWNASVAHDVVPAEVLALKAQPGADLVLGGGIRGSPTGEPSGPTWAGVTGTEQRRPPRFAPALCGSLCGSLNRARRWSAPPRSSRGLYGPDNLVTKLVRTVLGGGRVPPGPVYPGTTGTSSWTVSCPGAITSWASERTCRW